MNDYDFSTLNDKEFERLSLDLLNAEFSLRLQGFKIGRDKGIDLRYSTPANNNAIVVQAKHYVGSAYAQLKHTLKEKELKKVRNLKPERYIVVTSLPLSAQEKDELKEILSPFVLTSNDIIGKDDLNAFLRSNEEIEKTHFKLWFSSIKILKTIFNNAIEGRTKHHLQSVKNKIRFYVITKKLDDANKILNEKKLLLITGQPGIGKTTLADILLFDRAKKGFKIYKVENIREAEDVISVDSDEKQLFYFDDFLGANYFEIINANKTETQLTSFVERVKNSPNKYLILTTRTVILNHAIEKYEKISHSKMANNQFELKLTDYTRFEKALILYNHLYFTNVSEELYNSILTDQFYRTIIRHKNYTPRIIEFITDKTKIESLSPEQYLQFILNNLNNPSEIWRYSFNNQIEYLDKCLLLTLFTFPREIDEPTLINAFESRLEFEKNSHNQIINSDQFNSSVKILLNGFISSTIIKRPKKIREYSFINPSLGDFLIGYCQNSFQERKSILSSIKYAEQLHQFSPQWRLLPLEKELQLIIREKIAKDELEFVNSDKSYFTNNVRLGNKIDILYRFCSGTNIDSLLSDFFSSIDFEEGVEMVGEKLEGLLLNLGDSPLTYSFIKDNFIRIIEALMTSMTELDNAKVVPELFEKYEQNYEEYSETEKGLDRLISLVTNVLVSKEEELKYDKKDEVKAMTEVESIYDDVYSIEYELMSELLPNLTEDHDFEIGIDESYWKGQIEENIDNDLKAEHEAEMYQEQYKEAAFESRNEESAIDDLFIKPE
ncbi:hypothetical protein Oweho_0771 [Owenweeksia hongkongensis DSM 17368]|uniref:Restriction endonuclease type IV Mrr domain-containing protein n=1 Tax=Owenweeksia hongkongensis (strain DSM 17368 / CIP 108786 / JCM 12287 / NRRL B-23963 / UST20020801) TaxID=926562 RepID=G8R234_OWEHD|nr:restriction endonuclease [Owenweeksia hongkongensis]AEV31784.1 hypothetical protein Oweho_0771 [Owenweeksia hongkongensis DSM 17368]